MKKYFTARFARGTENAEIGKIFNLPLRPRRLCGERFRGFTLIELLIVMVVITIMVGITIPIAKYVTYRARMANQQVEIEKIKSALEDYRAAYGEYPITGKTNPLTGQIENLDDVARHYPANYATECTTTSNSPFTNVELRVTKADCDSTVERLEGSKSGAIVKYYYVDYCLTYPLMLKQLAEGARPFMDFKSVTVLFFVSILGDRSDNEYSETYKHRGQFGDVVDKTYRGIRGDPVSRPKAIDPVSQKQWKYRSEDGVTYTLTNYTGLGY